MSEPRPEHWVPASAAATLPELFNARVARTPKAPAYRYFDVPARRWRTLTWGEIAARAARWRAGFAALGLAHGDRVAILLRNEPDWVAVDQAALALGLVTVGLHCSDTAAANARLIADAGARAVVVAKGRWWRAVAGADADALPDVQCAVTLNADDAGDDRLRAVADWLPAKGDTAAPRCAPDDLAALIYTSGTTGNARGAMLTHANLVWNAYACADAVRIEGSERLISVLPLAHAFERTVDCYRGLITGATLSFCRHPRFLKPTLMQERPTAMIGVPQIYERYYTELHRWLGRRPRVFRRLVQFTMALGWSVFQRQQGQGPRRFRHLLWPFLRRTVAAPCLRPFGGRLEVAVSGAAALPQPVARTLLGLGLRVQQGYGLTEASPVVSVNRADDNDPTSVGTPLAGVETRLGADNELWVRSPGVMRGYWNDPEATAAVLESNGWLRTGDKVSRLDQKRLYLTGRVKEVIVMATGEKASPEPIEAALTLDPMIRHAVIVGEARPYLAAILECDADLVAGELEKLGLSADEPGCLASPRLEREMLRRAARQLKAYPAHAQVRRVSVTTDEWTVQNALLTPTDKVRRRAIARRYGREIRRLYGHRAVPEKTDFSYNVNVE
ncbi:AMP-dependent synthetase and ligase [Salinisphaera sp. PC39]|uniref:AMP-dependent synthetase/ligase n=1 Tax=Salinisphaera sp. PC39 TaxID=1304156 RepID=UPI00333ED93B